MRDARLDDTGKHYAIVARAIEYIRAYAYRQPALGDIAAAVNLSEHHLQRVFAEWAGVSPKRFLQYVTKQHARQALRESADILGEVETKQTALQEQWPAAILQRNDAHAAYLSKQIFPSVPQPGTLHLVLRGTNSQLKVWEALLKIAPAQRVSYSQLAAMVGTPRAQRAVGTAMCANTIGYLIPCHRVIRETGETGHYRWGSDRKVAMLAWEASRVGAWRSPD